MVLMAQQALRVLLGLRVQLVRLEQSVLTVLLAQQGQRDRPARPVPQDRRVTRVTSVLLGRRVRLVLLVRQEPHQP